MLHLTPRERQVAALVAKGFTNREIGQKLGISTQVVKNYMRDIFDRTGCWTRLELAVYVVGHHQAA